MYCARCGTPYEQGDRFCSSCGSNLKRNERTPSERRSRRDRVHAVVGRSRSARLLTAGTAIAIVVAIAAFIALPTKSSGVPQDSYTLAADRACVQEKQRIASLERSSDKPGGVEGLAQGLVLIAAEWRQRLEGSPPPPDRRGLVSALDSALLDVEVKAGTLAQLATGSNKNAVIGQAAQVDSASQGVERAIAALGLNRCSAMATGVVRGRGAG